MTDLAALRATIRADHIADEAELLARLSAAHAPDAKTRAKIDKDAADLVRGIRHDSRPGLMEVFLAEYGLSTGEGVALMCLAEALLRVPDAHTMDELIEDKIAPSEWGRHLGHSSSSLVNASTWALMLTGRVLREDQERGIASQLRGAVKRLGEPVIRAAVQRAMREMGSQFVLGETITAAMKRASGQMSKGYTYSYDMLGEAAMTESDAEAFRQSYVHAITALARESRSDDTRKNPGISIKLSALHPRYDESQRDRVLEELVPRVSILARQARAANMGLNIDAEEADRLEISLDVIEAVLDDPELAGWDGFGVVVQSYGRRAPAVLDWLYDLATKLDRKIMVRLVKGAYWDTEIKHAQVEGLEGFPVYTHKQATDAAYACCTAKLMDMRDRIYPQFATHNAHSAATVLNLAGSDREGWEFQRLHGMGEALHDILREKHKARCRIYAPVGAHRDLLAYLVRRLLENGANSSFVNRIVDTSVPPEEVAEDPFGDLDAVVSQPAPGVVAPEDLFRPRPNSQGFDLFAPEELARIDAARAPFAEHRWKAGPMIAGDAAPEDAHDIVNPARPGDTVGRVAYCSAADVETALDAARVWQAGAKDRAAALNRAADLYEEHFGEIFALLAREAGKTQPDAVAELREAVDFLRYYATHATGAAPRGAVVCISPWNFPLAIFTGQIAAALAAGNAVLAKPAETTSLIAARATELLHEAGVPATALQLLPGTGRQVGGTLSGDARVAGVCFTGSTATAQAINRSMADALDPRAPLIAETGGLNAMIVDSTALPEQAVRDIVASAFQSAGQRCSALRVLYVQRDVAKRVLEMLKGAMDELRLGDPWHRSTDIGPIITPEARDALAAHVTEAENEGRLLHRVSAPSEGAFLAPAMIKVGGIEDMEKEIFGPVLHVATFRAESIEAVLADINGAGYGLTFGLHTRIDDRVQQITARMKVGNLYVNRNQIGAIVGSQPFGGEGLSGTGPKAGGPHYVPRFRAVEHAAVAEPDKAGAADPAAVQSALQAARTDTLMRRSVTDLPGPTGESNRLSTHARGTVLCLGPTRAAAEAQAAAASEAGCAAVIVAPGAKGPLTVSGRLAAEALTSLQGMALVAHDGGPEAVRPLRQALAARDGALVPLAGSADLPAFCRLERHVCIDTTASGGNASLLAEAS